MAPTLFEQKCTGSRYGVLLTKSVQWNLSLRKVFIDITLSVEYHEGNPDQEMWTAIRQSERDHVEVLGFCQWVRPTSHYIEFHFSRKASTLPLLQVPPCGLVIPV